MADRIQWRDGAPKPSGLPPATIYRLRPGGKAMVWLLGDLVSASLHWIGESTPCLGAGCPHCPGSTQDRWYGPGVVAGPPGQDGKRPLVPIIVELPESCARALHGYELRGLVVELIRGGSARSRLVLRVPAEQPGKEPPAWFDVRPILERVWNTGRRRVDPEKSPEIIPFRRQA